MRRTVFNYQLLRHLGLGQVREGCEWHRSPPLWIPIWHFSRNQIYPEFLWTYNLNSNFGYSSLKNRRHPTWAQYIIGPKSQFLPVIMSPKSDDLNWEPGHIFSLSVCLSTWNKKCGLIFLNKLKPIRKKTGFILKK